MQTTLALAALAAMAYAAPQSGGIVARDAAPEGCSLDYSGSFQISAVESQVMKRDIYKRACGDPGSLVLTLAGGKLLDAKGRTGYIASNYQFQFDNPPQNGALATDGFSACNNGSLALGGSNIFYECLSGGFYNLYDRSSAAQCKPILIDILPCGSSGAIGQGSDGQPTGTSIATVTQISDGQPQAPTGNPAPISQISDGQPQAPTGNPVPISQISDGQPQAPTGNPVPISQISDGQPQAPTGNPVPISQISDGQPQAPTGNPVPISQISDGQPQAPTNPGGPVITQISDGQPQAPAPTVTSPVGTAPTLPGGSAASTAPIFSTSAAGTPAPSPITGGGNAVKGSMGLGAIAMVAAALL